MENLEIPKGDKTQIYKSLIPQIHSLLDGESDLYANLANVTAALNEAFNHLWTGFYLVKKDNTTYGSSLVLGPFQGPVACTRIAFGKGVCGTAWREGRTIVVPDVEKFPGHIACSSLSRSEIVVPFEYKGNVVALLDIDSKEIDTFDETDSHYLKLILPDSFWERCQFSLI
jgi:GAF domain-containing protein